MGQVNSQQQCPYHSLRTKHPEEGYCTLCNKRFSSLRGYAIPDEEDIEESKLRKQRELDDKWVDSWDEKISMGFYADDKPIRGLAGEKSPAELDEVARYVDIGRIEDARYNKNVDMHNMTWNRSHPHNIERNLRIFTSQDCIYRCFYCTRFFYSKGELLQHLNASGASSYRNHASHQSEAAAGANAFCGICERSYACSILDHLNSALLHIQRPGLSWKDIQLERMCDCCVRCGIYFSSEEQQRKHFIDVEYHILHVQVGLDNQADLQDDLSDYEDLEYPSAHLFPTPPSTLPTRPQPLITTSKTNPALKPASSVISLNSAYAPELRVAQSPSRLRYSQTSSSLVARPSSGIPIVTVEEQFECPLCLENEIDIASLPCGHVYGAECIRKTIASDPRCPLCRRAAEIRHIRRVWPEIPLAMAV